MRILKLIIASCVLAAVGSIVVFRARVIAQQASAALPVAGAPQPADPSAAAPVRTGGVFFVPGVANVPATPTRTLTIAPAPVVSEGSGDAVVYRSIPASQLSQFRFSDVVTDPASAVPEDEQFDAWVSQALSTYAQTEDQDARAKQRDEIAKGLDQIFDIRQEHRVNELKALEARVQKLRATLDQRATSKNEILKNRLDYLLREADGLGWGDGIPAPRRSGVTGGMPAGYRFGPNPFDTSLRPPATWNDRLDDPLILSPATTAEYIVRPPANPDSGPARE